MEEAFIEQTLSTTLGAQVLNKRAQSLSWGQPSATTTPNQLTFVKITKLRSFLVVDKVDCGGQLELNTDRGTYKQL